MTGTEQTSQEAPCPNCTKAGLPLLPLRYVIARDDAAVRNKAPALSAPFGEGVNDIKLPAASVKYSLRSLREGYLYVFNEARGTWQAYEVDDRGTLFEFDIRDKSPPPAADEDAPREVCSRHGDPNISQCIIIPDAHKAGAVWIGFSDVAWTRDVWNKHKKADYRKKHMRCIDVGAWVDSEGAQQTHLDAMTALSARVGEYALQRPEQPADVESEFKRKAREKRNEERVARVAQARREGREPDPDDLGEELAEVTVRPVACPAFDFSVASFHYKTGDGEDLLAEATKAGERGKVLAASGKPFLPAMVALQDPVGMAMDLASLMNERLAGFMAQPTIKRPLALSTLLGTLEEGIRNNAELEHIENAQNAAVDSLHVWNSPMWDPRIPKESFRDSHERQLKSDPVYRAEWEARAAAARENAMAGLSAEQLDSVADSAWKKYRRKLQDGQPAKWQRESYQPALKKFDREVIVPLAQAHVAWLKSPQMVGYMSCSHDEKDPASGVAYCDTVLLCIQDTQTITVNSKQYVEWLVAEEVKEDNLLLRAISLNQKAVVESLTKANGITLQNAATAPWSLLLEGYKKALEQLPTSQQSVPARVLVALAGPVMTALDTALNRGMGPLVVGLGLVAEQPIVFTQLRGTLDQAVDDLVRRMVLANPDLGQLDQARLRTRMRNQSAGRRQVTRARGPGTRGQNDILIIVDQLALGEIDANMTTREQLQRAGQSVMTFDEWQRSPHARWRTMTNGVNIGIVGVFLSLWSMKSLAKELDESTAKARTENVWRYSAAVLGVVGAVSDGLQTVLKNWKEVGSRLARRLDGFWNRILGFAGKVFGFAAALIFAIWDGVNAWEAHKSGQNGLAILYVVSAVSSVLAFAALAGWFGTLILGLSATGVGIFLAAIAVFVAVVIMLIKDDKLEAWMRRCWFGTAGGERFGSQEEEMAELDAMLKEG